MNEKGFSLLEMMIVIAIIGIISVIGAMNLFGMTEKAKISVDEANAANVANAAKIYLAENGTSNNVTIEELKAKKLIEKNFSSEPKSKKYKTEVGSSTLDISILEGEIKVKYGNKEAYPNPEADTE